MQNSILKVRQLKKSISSTQLLGARELNTLFPSCTIEAIKGILPKALSMTAFEYIRPVYWPSIFYQATSSNSSALRCWHKNTYKYRVINPFKVISPLQKMVYISSVFIWWSFLPRELWQNLLDQPRENEKSSKSNC